MGVAHVKLKKKKIEYDLHMQKVHCAQILEFFEVFKGNWVFKG